MFPTELDSILLGLSIDINREEILSCFTCSDSLETRRYSEELSQDWTVFDHWRGSLPAVRASRWHPRETASDSLREERRWQVPVLYWHSDEGA